MVGRLRTRFLVAMGLPLAACDKEAAHVDRTQSVASASSSSMTETATATVTPSVSASASVTVTASASASASAAATAAPLRKAPKEWAVDYDTHAIQSWCRTATAKCLPRGGQCAPSITVPCGCTPGGGCSGATEPCSAELASSVTHAQSAIYAGGACCYALPQHCLPPGAGRALDVRGERFATITPRDDWRDALVPMNDRAKWRAIARAEHASIASFARASLELLALGAPASLVRDTHRAALDEIRHARIAFALAGGEGPGPLPSAIEPIAPPTFASFARATFRDACVEETLGAIRMREAGRHDIADDEERHAELAWRTLAWTIREGGAEAKVALEAELAAIAHSDDAIIRELVVPLARALLAA